jgi:hypothetical protein
MWAARGAKSPGQRAAAYRQTYAQTQGLNPEQQRIAGMQGATVTPYGSMQVKNPLGQQPQQVARPATRPATGQVAMQRPKPSPLG